MKRPLSALRDFVFLATRHWLSALGVALASFAAVSFLVILALELAGMAVGNYAGLISYLILPVIFVLGLVLIPIGLRLRRKREKAGKPTRTRSWTSTTRAADHRAAGLRADDPQPR